ncbi:NAD(P)-dependent oxidoreductase [Phytoactinopolyspora endophytica]|uniref:NAD(P)-dependent oxidoreductase n=1 Tax=Phytoactinopolyspora endophytica TaxID=1642495 RepID=UPI00101DA6D3|nr:NAD(P)-binding oxidoreductase [Phytoactinopolyspora endophytica]
MRLAVFGASGRTGRHVVQQALSRGHAVTALVRDPTKLEDLRHEQVTVIQTDIMDAAGLAPHLSGHDAVVSALGPPESGPTSVCTDGTHAIVHAMQDAAVRRVVTVSMAAAHTAGDGPFTRFVVKPMLGRLLRHAVADALGMEKALAQSGLDYTTVRPPMLTDKPLSGSYRTRTDLNVARGYRIPRADVAHAVLEAVENPVTAGTAVAVAT